MATHAQAAYLSPNIVYIVMLMWHLSKDISVKISSLKDFSELTNSHFHKMLKKKRLSV